MKKIYLAIPYTGMAESSFEQSTKAAAEIMKGGVHNVFSPITNAHMLTEHGLKGGWAFWEKIDYQYIDWADEVWAIVPKEGYLKILDSVGVIGEINYAHQKEKPVYFFEIEESTGTLKILK